MSEGCSTKNRLELRRKSDGLRPTVGERTKSVG